MSTGDPGAGDPAMSTGDPAMPSTPSLSSLAADYDALRHGLGARRLPRDAVRLAGPDAADYLQGQCSQDLAPLEIGGAADSLLLAPDGKIVAVVRVSRVEDDAFVVDCEGGHGEAVHERLARFKLRSKFEMERISWRCLAVRGTGAERLGTTELHRLRRPGVVLAARTAHNGWGGVDLLGPDPTADIAGLRWCGEGAWEACRIEAGVPSMGHELRGGRVIPAETGLLDETVSFDKGCYTGQELVARLDARGSRVPRRLCGVVVAGGADTVPAVLGAELVTDKAVGTVTSAAWSPALEAVVGLAFVHRSVEIGATVDLRPADGSGEARGSGESSTATVRSLPLR
ncbi:MAG TPA: glycine cleavage T C-terminal barrel domain-containing protein [Acidimicrobiales bacterium]|jgi:folate-binding protein YgfZ